MEFSININAPASKVWDTLWADATYRQWTAPFSEGSNAVTDWQKGSKVLFLDGNGSGMVSTIAENIPHRYMSIRHLGMVKDGVEDLESEEVKQWAGAMENYTLTENDGTTFLEIELKGAAIPPEFEAYFQQTWPLALAKLKELSEG